MKNPNIPPAVRNAVAAGFYVCVLRDHKPTSSICKPNDVETLNGTALLHPGCSWGILLGKKYGAICVEVYQKDIQRLNQHCIKNGFGDGLGHEFHWRYTAQVLKPDPICLLFRWRKDAPTQLEKTIKVKRDLIEIDPESNCTFKGDEKEPYPDVMMSLMTTSSFRQTSSREPAKEILSWVPNSECKDVLGLNVRTGDNPVTERSIPDDVLVFAAIKIHKPVLRI